MTFRRISLTFSVVLLGLTLVACKKEGPAEKMGKEVDKAMEKTADSAKDTAKEAADKVKEATK